VVILPRFEPIAFLSAVSRYKATVALVVPPILLMLLHHPGTCSCGDPSIRSPTNISGPLPETSKHDLRTLATVISGAAPLGAGLVSAFREKLAAQGANVAVSQGLSFLPRGWSTP
jgi:4-coumarate--CoA ligase